MCKDEIIEYRNFQIEIWQAVHSKKWFYLIVKFGFCYENKIVAFDDKEQALTSAREKIDSIILADSQ